MCATVIILFMSEITLFEDKYQVSFLMDFYGTLLSKRTQDIMLLSLDEDMSLGEIAMQKGISRQAVHDSIKRGEESLLKYESELKLASKALKSRELIKQIRDKAQDFTVTDAALALDFDELLEKLYGLFLS